MSSNTKIVVLRSKELVYALVLLVVSVLIIMVAVSLFLPAKDSASPVPAQNAEESMEQVPSQVPSQTPSQPAPQTTPAGQPQGGSSNEATGTTDTALPAASPALAIPPRRTHTFPVSTPARCYLEMPMWSYRLPWIRTTLIPSP